MKEAIALVMPKVLNSRLKQWIDARAKQNGICIRWVDVSTQARQYYEVIRSCRNVLAWNCRVSQDWMREHGQNVLYIENSLICQSAGIFVDLGGYFSRSRLSQEQTWKQGYRYSLDWITTKWFGWQYGCTGTPDGPILVALQNRHDCNIQTEFPASQNEPDKVIAALKIAADYLPENVSVWIRPHPSERDSFDHGGIWRDHWMLDTTDSFAMRLPQARALVTVNSTCASEAMLTAMPVATLGTGAFTGSGGTLECSDDPSRLGSLLDSPVKMDARAKYASAVLARHFLPYDLAAPRPCQEFDDWITACQE